MFRRLAVVLALVYASLAVVPAVQAQRLLTTKGDNFWFGFMDNSIERAVPNLWIFVSVPFPDDGSRPTDSVLVYLRFTVPEERSFDPPYDVRLRSVQVFDSFRVAYGQVYSVVFPTTDNRQGSNHPSGLPDRFRGINKLYPRNYGYRLMNANQYIDAQGNSVPFPQNAINIQSTADINVFILNQRPFTTDASIVYPSGVQGSDYYVLAYDETRTTAGGDPTDPTNIRVDWVSQLMVVASDDVEITLEAPSAAALARRRPVEREIRLRDGRRLRPGEKITFRMSQGQTHLIQSNQDLTGCRVYIEGGGSCKGFSLFGGNQCTTVGNQAACDHVVEMILPIRDASNEYIITGPRLRRSERYRFTAIEDSTEVTVHSANPITFRLNTGEFVDTAIVTGRDGFAYRVSGNKPFLTTQNGMSLFTDQPGAVTTGWGDPYMLQMPGTEMMFAKSSSVLLLDFPPSRIATDKKWLHYVTILTQTDLVDYIHINDRLEIINYYGDVNPLVPISSLFKPVFNYEGYSWATIIYDIRKMGETGEPLLININLKDPSGQRQFGLDEGFAAFVVGYNNFDSYGYTAAVGMIQVGQMESSEFRRVMNPCRGDAKGEFWFRTRFGLTSPDLVDLPTDPNDPTPIARDFTYKFRLERLDGENGNVVETIENPQVYLVSGFQNYNPAYPQGLLVRIVGLRSGHYRVHILDYENPPCERSLAFFIEEPDPPIEADPRQFCYVPEPYESLSIQAQADGGRWCAVPGVLLDGRAFPDFTVAFNPETGQTISFNTEQFKDLNFRDRLEFTVQYVSPTFDQQKTNTIPDCDNGCPTPVPVLLRMTPEAQFRVAEALTEFDDLPDTLIFGDPEHMRSFVFRLENQTDVSGMNVRTRWFYQEDGQAPVEFTPDPVNPVFERPEFQSPLETEFRNYRIILEVTTVENDCQDTISKTVAIQYPNIIYFPNVFTPNGDGVNDVFRPFRTEGINQYLIIIYDRWGMEQFRSEDTNKHWDGTVNGRGEAQAGTYFWYAKYKSIAGVETVRTGSVSLIR